jgi:hypothetical protein
LIKELRRALDDRDTSAPIIRTAHGVGYAFAADLDRGAAGLRTATRRWVVVGTRRIPLDDGEHVIGRDPTASIHLDRSEISRRHARIVIRGGTVTIEDLGSKNGTVVNDALVDGCAPLKDGDHIRLGAAVIVFHSSTSGMSTETIAPTRKPSGR